LEKNKTKNDFVHPLFIAYAQKGENQEYKAAKAICNFVGIESKLDYLNMSNVGEFFRDRQKEKLHVPLPHRNLVLLSLALGYASQIHNKSVRTDPDTKTSIHLALIAEDFNKPNYTSGSSSFIDAFKVMANALDRNIHLELPYKDFSKNQVIQRGVDLGIDYDITYTCMLGNEKPCGHCMQCKSRAKAFQEYSESKGLH
jgi:7-cyano-7-deazaguanine synthase